MISGCPPTKSATLYHVVLRLSRNERLASQQMRTSAARSQVYFTFLFFKNTECIILQKGAVTCLIDCIGFSFLTP